jgi:hypothetical protein
VAGVLLLIIVAVPLYVLRRPRPAASGAEAPESVAAFGGVVKPRLDAGAPSLGVELGAVQRVKCSAADERRGNEGGLCDALPDLEESLRKGILGTRECAPRTGKEGSINYVLEVDFNKNRLNVFPGQSGKWKGPQARRAAKCVLSSLPPLAWDEMAHQYRY